MAEEDLEAAGRRDRAKGRKGVSEAPADREQAAEAAQPDRQVYGEVQTVKRRFTPKRFDGSVIIVTKVVSYRATCSGACRSRFALAS